MTPSRRSPLLSWFLVMLAALMLTAWTVEPVAAQRSSRSSDSFGSSSSRNSSSRSTRDDDDDDFESDDDDDSDSGSRRSRSRSSRDSRSDSSRSSRSSSRRSSSRSSSATYAPPAVVFGANYETIGLRPRGNLLSVEAFEALPCATSKVEAAGKTYYRCGETWYNQVSHEGWVCYSEVFPPAGLRVGALPKGHDVIRAGDRTLYATGDAFYEAVRDGAGTRYVVVEPAVGTVLERLPDRAKEGIPVRSGRHDYYRYLGVFYREETVNGVKRYVASASPFSAPPPTVAATTPAAPTSVVAATTK